MSQYSHSELEAGASHYVSYVHYQIDFYAFIRHQKQKKSVTKLELVPFEDEEEEELYYTRISRESGLSVPTTSLRHMVSSCRYCGFIMDCSTEQWEGKERHRELGGHDTFRQRQEHHCEFKGNLAHTLRVFLKIQNQRKQKQILKKREERSEQAGR